MIAWTDYPMFHLGDESGKRAPIREVRVVSYDGDKYCDVICHGQLMSIKAGYLYQTKSRYGESPTINTDDLPRV